MLVFWHLFLLFHSGLTFPIASPLARNQCYICDSILADTRDCWKCSNYFVFTLINLRFCISTVITNNSQFVIGIIGTIITSFLGLFSSKWLSFNISTITATTATLATNTITSTSIVVSTIATATQRLTIPTRLAKKYLIISCRLAIFPSVISVCVSFVAFSTATIIVSKSYLVGSSSLSILIST